MANTYKALSTVTVGAGGASSIEITNIPQTYSDLKIVLSVRSDRAGVESTGFIMSAYNNSAAVNLTRRWLLGNGSIVSTATATAANTLQVASVNAATSTASTFANYEMYIPNYAGNANYKPAAITSVYENNGTDAIQFLTAVASNNNDPITSIKLTVTGGNFVQHSTATLYGVFNADISVAPSAPTIGTATADNKGGASVTFTANGSAAASYAVTSSPGSFVGTGASSPVTVSGLTAGTAYTFTVTASNPMGTSASSAASNSITAYNTTLVGLGSSTSGNYSRDGGATWTSFTFPVTTGANVDAPGEYIVYGQNKFVVVPYNQANLYYSSTGYSSWTSVAIPGGTYNGAALGYVPNVGFISLSMYSSQRTMNSTNGTSWTAGGTATNVGLALGYVNGTWYCSGHNDTTGYYSTNLGSSWTTNSSWSPAPYFGTFGIGASNGTTSVFTGQYGSSNTLWYTTTGTTVTAGTMPSTASWYGSQCYGYEAGIYVAGDGITSASSTNGTTWTARTGIASTGRFTVYAADTGFIRLPGNASSNTIATSADGITWTLKASGVSLNNFWTLASAQVVNQPKTAV